MSEVGVELRIVEAVGSKVPVHFQRGLLRRLGPEDNPQERAPGWAQPGRAPRHPAQAAQTPPPERKLNFYPHLNLKYSHRYLQNKTFSHRKQFSHLKNTGKLLKMFLLVRKDFVPGSKFEFG